MNLGDIKTQVKRIFGDESEVQLTNDDIMRWVNAAQAYFVIQNRGLLEETRLLSSVAGQQEYPLPTDMLVLDAVSYKESGGTAFYNLQGRTLKEFDEYISGWDGSLWGVGTPSSFHKYANKLRLFPIPDFNGTDNIKLYIRKRPVAVDSDDDVPEVPVDYHNAIVQYVLQKAYQMDEDYEASQLAANSVTEDLRLNSEKPNWTIQRYFPTITVMPEDADW